MDGLHPRAVVALVLSRVWAAVLDDAVSTAVWAVKLGMPVPLPPLPPLPWPFGPRRKTMRDLIASQTTAAAAEQVVLDAAITQATAELAVLRALIDCEKASV